MMIDGSEPVFAKQKEQQPNSAASEGQNVTLVNKKDLVLVIDDTASMVEALSDVLHVLDYDVVAALDGNDGLSIFEVNREDISLVILDLNMPLMTGEETLRRLRDQDPDIQVIVSSSISEEETRRRCREEGQEVHYFLSRPYEPEQTKYLLNHILENETHPL